MWETIIIVPFVFFNQKGKQTLKILFYAFLKILDTPPVNSDHRINRQTVAFFFSPSTDFNKTSHIRRLFVLENWKVVMEIDY